MHTKVVLRVLDALNHMLGWQEVQALAKGDGCLWAEAPIQIPIDEDGIPDSVSVHWADMNVEVRSRVEMPALRRGQVATLPAGILMNLGAPAENLPPVTTRSSVAINVPTGSMSAASGT